MEKIIKGIKSDCNDSDTTLYNVFKFLYDLIEKVFGIFNQITIHIYSNDKYFGSINCKKANKSIVKHLCNVLDKSMSIIPNLKYGTIERILTESSKEGVSLNITSVVYGVKTTLSSIINEIYNNYFFDFYNVSIYEAHRSDTNIEFLVKSNECKNLDRTKFYIMSNLGIDVLERKVVGFSYTDEGGIVITIA